MSNAVPLTIQMGALPLNFQGTPQQIGDEIAKRLTVVAQQSFALFVTGAAEPFSNVGPWLDTSVSPIGVWKNWDDATGRYQPITIIDEQRGYILSVDQPDPNKFKMWIKLLANGKSQSVNTFFGGAWTDVYTDKFAALQLSIDNSVTKPYGSAGTVYTSTGAATNPVWSAVDVLPVGAFFPFAGTSLPANYLFCSGQVVPISSYPELFAVIGVNFGGDGVSNFGIPDSLGRGFVGVGLGDAADATAWLIGEKRGTEAVALTDANNGPHAHTTVVGTGNAKADGNAPGGGLAVIGGSNTGSSGSGTPHANIQPSQATNWIIKYK